MTTGLFAMSVCNFHSGKNRVGGWWGLHHPAGKDEGLLTSRSSSPNMARVLILSSILINGALAMSEHWEALAVKQHVADRSL